MDSALQGERQSRAVFSLVGALCKLLFGGHLVCQATTLFFLTKYINKTFSVQLFKSLNG